MKNFFFVAVGGVLAVVIGVTFFVNGQIIIAQIFERYPDLKGKTFFGLASSVAPKPIDGTSIAGLKRLVRYTASEEEGLITSATLSLSKTNDGIISAKGYIIQNLNDGKVIFEHDSERLLPIASLTKLVTAVIAKKVIKDGAKIKITREITSVYGNTAQFQMDETLKAEDLYYPLLMVSSNDSAEALARSYGRKRFIEAMNEFAQSIGAYRTVFRDPSGLSPDNRSTAEDVATIYSWIMENEPEIIEITKLKSKVVRAHTWTNPAHFLSWSNYGGGKNGYTVEAKQTGVAVFYINKIPYVVVVLGSSARDGDIIKLLGKVQR